MAHNLLFLLLIHLRMGKSEDPLQNIKWRQNITSDKKLWLQYVDKFVLSSILKISSVLVNNWQQLMWCHGKVMLEKSTRVVSICHRKCVTIKDEITSVAASSEQHRPIIHLRFSSTQTNMYFFHFQFIYSFDVSAFPMFNWNITLQQIILWSVHKHCFGNVLKIDVFVFCGIHSTFSLYPGRSDIIFSAHIMFVYDSSFAISFMVYSESTIKNEKPDKNYKTQCLFVHHVIPSSMAIFTIHVSTRVFQTLCLKVLTGFTFFVFDGPGLQSQILDTFIKGTYIETSSFQSIVQIISHNFSENTNISFHGLDQYFERNLSLYHLGLTLNVDAEHFSQIFFPTFFYVNKLTTERQSAIEVTVSFFAYHGAASHQCNFGGIAFVNKRNISFVKTQTFCNKEISTENKTWNTPWKIYSTSPEAYLVLYFYHPYSTIKFQAKVTSTVCKVIHITVCNIKQLAILDPGTKLKRITVDLAVNSCTVIHLTSGLNTNEEDKHVSNTRSFHVLFSCYHQIVCFVFSAFFVSTESKNNFGSLHAKYESPASWHVAPMNSFVDVSVPCVQPELANISLVELSSSRLLSNLFFAFFLKSMRHISCQTSGKVDFRWFEEVALLKGAQFLGHLNRVT